MNNTKCLALIDSRAQLSTITVTFTQQLGLEIHQLNNVLKHEAMGEDKNTLYVVCWSQFKNSGNKNIQWRCANEDSFYAKEFQYS